MSEQYALFKYVTPSDTGEIRRDLMSAMWLSYTGPSCDCDEDEGESCPRCATTKSKAASKKKPAKQLVFISMVSCPAEVAKLIRKSPNEEYVILRGQMHAVKVAMPVFMDGRNLDTLNAEWTA